MKVMDVVMFSLFLSLLMAGEAATPFVKSCSKEAFLFFSIFSLHKVVKCHTSLTHFSY